MTDTLTRLPPSATLVCKILEYRGPLTRSELIDETSLPESTLKDALRTLIEMGLVTREHRSDDARSHYYALDRDGNRP